jgi:hypothetical protein
LEVRVKGVEKHLVAGRNAAIVRVPRRNAVIRQMRKLEIGAGERGRGERRGRETTHAVAAKPDVVLQTKAKEAQVVTMDELSTWHSENNRNERSINAKYNSAAPI